MLLIKSSILTCGVITHSCLIIMSVLSLRCDVILDLGYPNGGVFGEQCAICRIPIPMLTRMPCPTPVPVAND